MFTHTLAEIALNYFIISSSCFLTIPLIAETKSVVIPAVLLLIVKW